MVMEIWNPTPQASHEYSNHPRTKLPERGQNNTTNPGRRRGPSTLPGPRRTASGRQRSHQLGRRARTLALAKPAADPSGSAGLGWGCAASLSHRRRPSPTARASVPRRRSIPAVRHVHDGDHPYACSSASAWRVMPWHTVPEAAPGGGGQTQTASSRPAPRPVRPDPTRITDREAPVDARGAARCSFARRKGPRRGLHVRGVLRPWSIDACAREKGNKLINNVHTHGRTRVHA
ncbi:unnamed protein product [Urochloa humidicola]